jgi:FkbM family methyltransferase
MENDLIFDLGMHVGQDTEFYLKKGFRVVAVEADPELCTGAEQRFASSIRDRRLTIVNKAIAREPGMVKFYRNVNRSIWGTIDPERAERNVRLRTVNELITVEATTLPDLLQQFGVPYYLKIDIEGLDMVAVEGLAGVTNRPQYVSIESDTDSFKALRREIRTFMNLGYDRFKVVNQERVHKQIPPKPPLEGEFVVFNFGYGATGLFGEEAPGSWLTAEQAIEAYRPIFFWCALTGDEGFVRNELARRVLNRLGFRSGWYDTHAKRSTDC